jgi:hypothetical protein
MAPLVDNCGDCTAWGITRHDKWLCQACRDWRRRYLETTCPACSRVVVVNERGFCRLCTRVAINRQGQQLFFADMILKKRGKTTPAPVPPTRHSGWPVGYPVTHRQLELFNSDPTLSNEIVRRLPDPPIAALGAALQQAVADHGDRHGWGKGQRDGAWRGIRVLLAIQDTPGAPITMTEADILRVVENTTVQPVVEVLASVDMLDDDRPPPLEEWFNGHAADLPPDMRHELAEWFHDRRDGSTSPPFRYLKARKLIFVNPTARLRGDPVQPTQPLPIDLDAIRDTLHSPDPARAALAALIAFHGLRTGQARRLLLTDVPDGRLHVDGNVIVLADPVRRSLNTWLAERAHRWPNTINPHLFVTARTAVRTMPVSSVWISDNLGVLPRQMREDRILNEAIATGGDVRRLSDLFGINVMTAQRYADVILKPNERDLITTDHAVVDVEA